MNREEAIKIVKSHYPANKQMLNEALETLIPELKEDEDVLTWLKNYISEEAYSLSMDIRDNEDRIKLKKLQKSLAWLETQGEQKPTDKIQIGKEYKCIASPRYSTFMTGKIYKPEDKFLCDFMNFCSDCFEPIEDSEQIDLTSNTVKVEPKFKVGDIVQYITDSTDRRKIEEVDTLCNMYYTDSSPIMFEIEDEWKVVVNAEDVEQKPTDEGIKAEPKFKVGDWIITPENKVLQITSIKDTSYKFNNESHYWEVYYCDKRCRLWTIEDAKDGDVLYHETKGGIKYIVMNKGLNEHGNINSYFRYNSLDGFGVDIPAVLSTRLDGITPATKEQRDILFKKMKENGYEWDAENKKLTTL